MLVAKLLGGVEIDYTATLADGAATVTRKGGVGMDDICNDGDDHRINLTVTILDTVTGLTHTITGGNTYWWTDGNGSCDCNRWPADESGSHCRGDSGVCDGCHRFRVVCVEPLLPGYELEDFNRGYD
jgi:hypothetical protein